MRKFIILFICVIIGNGIQAASLGKENDGYNYDEPSISFGLPTQPEVLVNEEAVQVLDDTSNPIQPEASEAFVAPVESEVVHNEATEIVENEAQPVEIAADLNLEQNTQHESDHVEAAISLDVSEAVAVPVESEVVHNEAPEIVENVAQAVEIAADLNLEQNTQHQSDHVEAALSLDVPEQSTAVEDHASVQETVEAHETEKVVETVPEVSEAAVELQQETHTVEEISQQPTESVAAIEQSSIDESVSHALTGYSYEEPAKPFTQPPPLPEQLAVEVKFMHQELGSKHKPHRHGAVKRIKLGNHVHTSNSVSFCEGRDWKTVVERRRQQKPKNRRLAPYTEVITGEEYFHQ